MVFNKPYISALLFSVIALVEVRPLICYPYFT